MQKITPFIWFDNNAEEAMNFYVSIFKDSRVLAIQRYSEAGPGPAGSVMAVSFELNGQEFAGINGGPIFKLSEAVSFAVACDTQEEIDYYWDHLLEGGEERPCGWLKDKFGLFWQVHPPRLLELMRDPDPAVAKRVAEAMFKMKKIILADLEKAALG